MQTGLDVVEGVSRAQLAAYLRDRASAVESLVATPDPWQILLQFVRETAETVRGLSLYLSAADVSRLALTPTFDRLMTMSTTPGTDKLPAVVRPWLDGELQAQVIRLRAAATSLQQETQFWAGEEALVVLDTGVYLNTPRPIEHVDIWALAQVPADRDIRLLVPMVVVDELDRLKRDHRTRGRASIAVALISKLLAKDPFGRPVVMTRSQLQPAEEQALLSQEGGERSVGAPAAAAGPATWPVGVGHRVDERVTLELLPDPPGHTRLPDSDDEIVRRALTVQQAAGRPVRHLVYDTGHELRAALAGLHVVKLQHARGDASSS